MEDILTLRLYSKKVNSMDRFLTSLIGSSRKKHPLKESNTDLNWYFYMQSRLVSKDLDAWKKKMALECGTGLLFEVRNVAALSRTK